MCIRDRINNCRKNKTTIIGVGLLDPSSLSLYTITESQYLETINNDDNNNSSTCNSSTNNIRTISFADTDEDEDESDDDSNDDNDENVNDDEDATLRTSSRWDTNGTSSSTSTSSNNMKSASLLLQQQQQQQSCMSKTINRDNDVRIDCPPTRPVRRKASTTI